MFKIIDNLILNILVVK